MAARHTPFNSKCCSGFWDDLPFPEGGTEMYILILPLPEDLSLIGKGNGRSPQSHQSVDLRMIPSTPAAPRWGLISVSHTPSMVHHCQTKLLQKVTHTFFYMLSLAQIMVSL